VTFEGHFGDLHVVTLCAQLTRDLAIAKFLVNPKQRQRQINLYTRKCSLHR